jgi:hypothetical protein
MVKKTTQEVISHSCLIWRINLFTPKYFCLQLREGIHMCVKLQFCIMESLSRTFLLDDYGFLMCHQATFGFGALALTSLGLALLLESVLVLGRGIHQIYQLT